MLINKDQLHDLHARGILQPGAGWGDAKKTACLMSALTGRSSVSGCVAEGWPEWMAELGTLIFDTAGDEWWPRSVAFTDAVIEAEKRGADFDRVFRDIRLYAVLPIAMEAIGSGDEPWRVKCRKVVQWSIDHDGEAAEALEAVRAAGAAGAAWAAGAAVAAGAVWAAWAAGAAVAAGAVWAAWAAGAARAAGAEAYDRIFAVTIAALRGDSFEHWKG